MPSILSKNCVLAGEVESYCLVCCKLLPAEHDVLAHIQQEKHKHNLSAHDYIDKFRRDCIRKVSGVYFCELCNQTFPTAAKVSLHVTELTHVEHKRGRMLTRGDNCIVFNENILITDNAWNGLVDDTCVLCNAEFEHDSVHKSEQKHILNLIKSRVTISYNNDIYRQVDGIYQCLTCNKIVSANLITEHSDSEQHKSLLHKCDRKQDDAFEENGAKEHVKDKIADKKDARDNDDVDNKPIDKNTKTPKEVDTKDVDGKTLFTRPVQMKKTQNPATSIPKDVKSFAKEYDLSIKNGNKVNCTKCSAEVPATQHGIKEHVAGSKHTDKLTNRKDVNKQASTNIRKVLQKDFIAELSSIADETSVYFVVNDSIVVSFENFNCIVRNKLKVFSQFFNKELSPSDYPKYITAQHQMFDNVYVITSVENEFIRQLKVDLYDCVYCGHVERSWADILKHIGTSEHKQCKKKYEVLSCLYRRGVLKPIETRLVLWAAMQRTFLK